eukprot:s262_g24.t1
MPCQPLSTEPQEHREVEQHLKHVSPLSGYEDLAVAVETDPKVNALVSELLDPDHLLAQALKLEDPHCPSQEVQAMVTKLLSRAEMLSNPRALEAVKAEADGLLKAGTWDLSSVREKEDVRAEAKKSGVSVHFGQLMTIALRSGYCVMLLLLSAELRDHVLMQLDPWTLCKVYLTSSNTVPPHVTAMHTAALQRLRPELELEPDTPLGSILRMLVVHVADPVLELDRLYMEFPGFLDDVFATVHILGKQRQHNISRPRVLQALGFPPDSVPTLTEHSDGPCMAIGMSIINRFALMYADDPQAQAAATILRLGSYCYEVFHGAWPADDIALLRFEVCGISGVVCLTVEKSETRFL